MKNEVEAIFLTHDEFRLSSICFQIQLQALPADSLP